MSISTSEIPIDCYSIPQKRVNVLETKKFFTLRRFPNLQAPKSPGLNWRKSNDMSAKLKKKGDVLNRLGRSMRSSTFITKFPSFSIIFRILKHFKKWRFYHSYENLQQHHLRILNDKAIIVPRESISAKTYESIWKPVSRRKPKRAYINQFFYTPLKGALAKVYRSSLLKDATYKIDRLISRTPLFNPNHFFKIFWDIFVLITLLIKFFIYSVDRSFDLNQFNCDPVYENFLTFTIFVIIFDSLVTINTKIYLSGNPVDNRVKILWNYLKRYSIIDVPTCFGLILNDCHNDYAGLREIHILLILKILFCNPELGIRVRSFFVKGGSTVEAIYDLLSLGASILISGHMLACLWHFVSFNYSKLSPEGISWLSERGILLSDWKVKYTHSFYWSITTMLTVGYGDITPKNNYEILFNIWAMLYGCVLFGYSMNRIGEIIKRRSILANVRKDKTNRLHVMSRGMNLSSDLETRIMKYMEYFWEQEEKVDPSFENSIMTNLSSSLRDQIYFETNVKYLKSIPVFTKIFNEKTLFELAHKLRKIRYPPEEYIYKDKSYGDSSLYIVLDGKVEISTENEGIKSNNSTNWETYEKNDYFGIHELFTDFGRRGGAVTRDFSTCFQLSRQDLLSVVGKEPIEYEKFCKMKDELILYQNQFSFELKCTSCGRFDHRTFDCPFLNFRKNKISTIGRYQFLKKGKKRKLFRRNNNKKLNTLLYKNTLNKELNEYLENMEGDEEFNELLMNLDKENEHESPKATEKDTESHPSFNKLVENPSLIRIEMDKIDSSPRNHERHLHERNQNLFQMKSHNDINFPGLVHHRPRQNTQQHVMWRTYSKSDIIWKNIMQSEKMNNFKYYFPKSNCENVIAKLNDRIVIGRRSMNRIQDEAT